MSGDNGDVLEEAEEDEGTGTAILSPGAIMLKHSVLSASDTDGNCVLPICGNSGKRSNSRLRRSSVQLGAVNESMPELNNLGDGTFY